MARVGIIDYDAGNLKSVETALHYLNVDFVLSSDPRVLEDTEKLIFPGVGEAGAAMKSLRQYGLVDFIRNYEKSGRNILGICIGAQIVLNGSEETDTPCIGIVPGRAKRFPRMKGYKIPHMGWNNVVFSEENPLFEKIPRGASFYFVHSYYPEPENRECVLSTTEYGIEFCSSFHYGNLYAVQFHPEKSGKWGLQLLKNFAGTIGTDCVRGD